MKELTRVYRGDLDILKGFAIIAVILYHAGICKSGYLGVDIFFVISGYLTVPQILHKIETNSFSYINYLYKRWIRLAPPLLIVSTICLLLGYIVMLPDDYENLNESIVASNFFANNILSAITTKNYWDVVNDYKPLMHTWYIGVLFQFYIIIPLILLVVKCVSKFFHLDFPKICLCSLVLLSLASLFFYVIPPSGGGKFYYLQYRFYELCFGGIAGCYVSKFRKSPFHLPDWIFSSLFVLILVIIFTSVINKETPSAEYSIVNGMKIQGALLINKNVLLLSVFVLTTIYVLCDNSSNSIIINLSKCGIFGMLGKMSYSLFLWHQPVLAFYRYCISDNLAISSFFVLIVVVIISLVSYLFVERIVKPTKVFGVAFIFTFILLSSSSLWLYLKAGVVRDVPELGLEKRNAHKGMFALYNDRIYEFDKPFPTKNNKINVLVVGDSFSRDWANILLESEWSAKINLSYHYTPEEVDSDRIKKCDYLFISEYKHNVPSYYWRYLRKNSKAIGVGTKNFGSCNGIVYRKRFSDDYFNQTIEINPIFYKINNVMKKEWEGNYVDMMSYVKSPDNHIRVFTNDNKFISQDCRHLTQFGAKYYASVIDFDDIFILNDI